MTMHRVFFTAIQIDGYILKPIHIDTKLDLAACDDLGGLLVETTRVALAQKKLSSSGSIAIVSFCVLGEVPA